MLQTNANLLTGINNDLSGLASAVNPLKDVLGPLTAMTAASSQSTILTASAQPSASAGTHTVIVSTLATQGVLYTNAVSDANTSILPSGVTSADIQFQVGGTGAPTHDIAISSGTNDTLNKVVSYINGQTWGVTARVISDASGARLAIFSNTTGSTDALAITNNTSGLSFNPPVGGTDATFSVDGIPFSSTSNAVSEAIPGVTLNLLGAYPGVQVQVSVKPDTNQAIQAIGDFVSAYNAVVADLNKQFTVDPSTNSQGPLASDSAMRSLQSSLLADATYSPAKGTYTNLAALGISMNNDGSLSIDSTQLSNAVSNDPAAVLGFFQKADQKGFANLFAKDLQNLTDPTLGLLNVDLAQNRTSQQDLSNSIADLQDRITNEQQQLETKYSQVNAILQAFPYQLQAIQLELGIAPSNSSGKSSIG